MTHLVIASAVVMLCLASHPRAGTECSEADLVAALTPSDPAYRPAMLLAERVLLTRGVTLRCVLRSTMENTFEKQVGAALYRTDRGDFEALFLSEFLSFDELTVVERMENGLYVYSYSGGPKPWPVNRIESVRRIYFIKHSSSLLVAQDPKLAALLAPAIPHKNIHR